MYDFTKVKKAALSMQRYSWEQGVLAQAFLENGDEEKYKEEICDLCLKKFYKYYVPRDIIFLEDLPQTPLMKIDFMKLTKADANKARETKKVE